MEKRAIFRGRMCGKMVIVYAKFSDYFFDEFYVSVC